MLSFLKRQAQAVTQQWAHDLFGAGAMAYLLKDKISELVPFLEDVLKNDYETGWKQVMDKLEAYFNEHWDAYWKEKADVLLWY